MKQLTQAIFDGAPDWVKSAAVDSDGGAYRYECKKRGLSRFGLLFDVSYAGDRAEFVGEGFDATDWQNSAIDREVSK